MAGHDSFDHSIPKPSSLVFDRSFSLHSTPQSSKKLYLDRYGSIKKSTVENGLIDGKVKKLCNSFESASTSVENPPNSSKPLCKRSSDVEIDSNFASNFRRTISSSKQLGFFNFNPSRLIKSLGSGNWGSSMLDNQITLPGTEDRIVVYFTSLRGIRRTYEDCCTVRMIFKGFRVPVDERDISMDSAYRKELQSVLGEKTVILPQIFIRGKYIGGAEEIKQLHEVGELGKLLKGFPARDPRLVCESCGDARFVPCLNCNGSRKLFSEDEGLLRRCLDCNENGLMRCPNCCC